MDKKDDLRVVKTKKVLYETLIDLMKTKTFEEIKVSDICSKALINRSTFYAHYEDKYELLLEFINSLKEEFINELSKNKNILNTREYYLEMIRLFLDHIENKKDIYNAIMINNRNSIMMDILSSVANNEVIKKMESSNISTKVPANIIAKFYLGGVLNLGIEWLRDTNKYSKEEIIKYLEILLPKNIEW